MRSRRASDLSRELSRLGVAKGALVMVHASLGKLGPVAGGADGVIDALEEALGSQGTLLMVLGADPDELFDAATTPVDVDEMGVLAEVFRRRSGTRVNDHAAARFGASGPLAATILEPVPLHDYFGPGSVLARFCEAQGWVLRLGANPNTITLTHWAEYLADLPGKRRVRCRYERADCGEQWIESLDDTEGIAEWSEGDYFPQIFADFRDAGHLRTGPAGACLAELFSAAEYVEFAVKWLERHLCRREAPNE